MKLALLLPGYLDSPDYLHLKTFDQKLTSLGYIVERLDPCGLWWSRGDIKKYSVTNYLKQIKDRLDHYKDSKPDEVVIIGHSLGGLISIVAGNRMDQITKVKAFDSHSRRRVNNMVA